MDFRVYVGLGEFFGFGFNFSISFKIPWTRITSEPVVVTINTLEFVAKLKDSDTNQNSRKPTPDTTFLNNSDTLNTSNSQNQISEQQQQQMHNMQSPAVHHQHQQHYVMAST